MSNHTFTPGTRVSDTGKNITGTVADDPAMTAEYPGMIPVHWDNGDRTVAAPSILAAADTESTHAAAVEYLTAEAVEHLRNNPELATRETTVTDLCHASTANGLPASTMLKAWGIVTGTAL